MSDDTLPTLFNTCVVGPSSTPMEFCGGLYLIRKPTGVYIWASSNADQSSSNHSDVSNQMPFSLKRSRCSFSDLPSTKQPKLSSPICQTSSVHDSCERNLLQADIVSHLINAKLLQDVSPSNSLHLLTKRQHKTILRECPMGEPGYYGNNAISRRYGRLLYYTQSLSYSYNICRRGRTRVYSVGLDGVSSATKLLLWFYGQHLQAPSSDLLGNGHACGYAGRRRNRYQFEARKMERS